MARSLSFVVGGVGIVLAAVAVTMGGGAPKTTAPVVPPAVQAAAAELGSRLRETAAALDARASTLADKPRLRVAVATDAATVRDLTVDELEFHALAGETIEIGQVFSDGKIERLYRCEGGTAPQAALDHEGQRLLTGNDALFLEDVVRVKPRDRSDELRGALALSRVIDTAPLAEALDKAGCTGVLVVGSDRLKLGQKAAAAGAPELEVPIAGEPAHGAKLLVQAPPPVQEAAGIDRRAIAAVLSLVALVIAALLFRRGSGTSQQVGSGPPAMQGASSGSLNALPAGSAISSSQAGASGSSITSGASGVMATVPQDSATDVGATSTAGSTTPGFAATEISSTGAPRSTLATAARNAERTHIGRYRLVRPLGSGGMADVYLASVTGEAGFEKQIALKVLQERMARQKNVVEHFLDEARLASRLTHPNIVQITDLGRAGDEYFIAMEYVEGSDLEHLLEGARERNVQVPARVAMTIVRHICAGLHAAHTAVNADGTPLDLVHRDVKSANVFVAKNGAVKIGDFGIAKANEASRSAKTEVGQVKGTAAYMAPEHRLGESVDRRADVFAVGAIAYEAFTGIGVNMDLLRLIQLPRAEWPHLTPPSKVHPELSPDLDAIIFKALAYERDDRYATCQEMEDALEAIADRDGLNASDRTVAHWVEAELALQRGESVPVGSWQSRSG